MVVDGVGIAEPVVAGGVEVAVLAVFVRLLMA
jgi:hypothetical protein